MAKCSVVSSDSLVTLNQHGQAETGDRVNISAQLEHEKREIEIKDWGSLARCRFLSMMLH
jgi:hypothetical protein